MDYKHDDYIADLKDPSMPHIQSRDRFQAFYNELGKEDAQKEQAFQSGRMSFVEPKGRILELGCHWGFDLIEYAKAGFEVVGIDVSETLVAFGKDKISLLPIEIQNRITIIHGWIEDFTPTQQFDTVILTETLEHVIDPQVVLYKAYECMGSDGLLYISTPSRRVGTFSHVRGIDNDEMEKLLISVRLTPVKWCGNADETKVVAKKL